MPEDHLHLHKEEMSCVWLQVVRKQRSVSFRFPTEPGRTEERRLTWHSINARWALPLLHSLPGKTKPKGRPVAGRTKQIILVSMRAKRAPPLYSSKGMFRDVLILTLTFPLSLKPHFKAPLFIIFKMWREHHRHQVTQWHLSYSRAGDFFETLCLQLSGFLQVSRSTRVNDILWPRCRHKPLLMPINLTCIEAHQW